MLKTIGKHDIADGKSIFGNRHPTTAMSAIALLIKSIKTSMLLSTMDRPLAQLNY